MNATAAKDAHERRDVVPTNSLAQVGEREDRENRERDDFLDDLQLGGGEVGVALAIGGNHQAILEEGDAPARQRDESQQCALELQMPIPNESHEDVRADEQQDGKPAGLDEVAHYILSFFSPNPEPPERLLQRASERRTGGAAKLQRHNSCLSTPDSPNCIESY